MAGYETRSTRIQLSGVAICLLILLASCPPESVATDPSVRDELPRSATLALGQVQFPPPHFSIHGL